MALNPDPVGEAIANYVQTQKPDPGEPITTAELITLWQGIVRLLYADINANSQVPPGSFQVTGVQAGSDTVAVQGIGGPVL